MLPATYFKQQLDKHSVTLAKLKRKALLFSMLRLVVFLTVVALVYFFTDSRWIIVTALVLGIAAFLFLVAKYTDVKAEREFHKRLKQLNEDELKVLDNELEHLDGGEEYIRDEHFFSKDIDLFGPRSIFQWINRSGTEEGRTYLANLLVSNDVKDVSKKQEAIRELSQLSDWRQHFQVTASIIDSEVKTSEILRNLSEYKSEVPKIFKWIPLVFSTISFLVIILYSFGVIPAFLLGAWFFLGLGISGFYLKAINRLYVKIGKIKDNLSQYASLIAALESQKFSTQLNIAFQSSLETAGKKASLILGELGRDVSNLDQRNNIFFGILANGFLLWDLKFGNRIEHWIESHTKHVQIWLEVVSKFDAYNSLANYAFIKPNYVYPLISNTETEVMSATGLGHPLLKEDKRVDNNVSILNGDFFIITGANMAGKSTFLRTVGLNLVMANCGLPVCANSFTYKPIKLISSMRTSDSLKDDESYFFSELKRLKTIVEAIKQDTYFIILDEILKGTNSKDKAEGSKQFVKRLVASQSTGLIATHDLSLCTVSDEYDQVKNYFFEAEIIQDELYFDYKLKEGICQNMNASFLLKKMDIV